MRVRIERAEGGVEDVRAKPHRAEQTKIQATNTVTQRTLTPRCHFLSIFLRGRFQHCWIWLLWWLSQTLVEGLGCSIGTGGSSAHTSHARGSRENAGQAQC